MKLITAVIKPHRLDDVKEALSDVGVGAMTVSEVKGFGRQGGRTETYRGAEYRIDFVPKIKVEIVAETTQVTTIIDAIRSGAQSGKIGDGKIWVSDVDSVVRIRTGDTGAAAI